MRTAHVTDAAPEHQQGRTKHLVRREGRDGTSAILRLGRLGVDLADQALDEAPALTHRTSRTSHGPPASRHSPLPTVAVLAPKDLRGSAFGLLAAVQSLGDLAASTVAGILWTTVSPSAAFTSLTAWMLLALAGPVAAARR